MAELSSAPEQKAKITLYWLELSRAHRILWLLEELNLTYDLQTFKRGPDKLAPPELKKIHPLGKSPLISIQGPNQASPKVIAESGAIVEYLLEYFGKSWIPDRYPQGHEGEVGAETEEWTRYRFYMHYAEGSIMPLMLMSLVVSQIKNASVPFFIKPVTNRIAGQIDKSFLDKQFKLHFDFLEQQLASSSGEWFCGHKPTGADVMMIYPLHAGESRAGLTAERYPKTKAWIDRILARPAYQRAIKNVEEATGEEYRAKF